MKQGDGSRLDVPDGYLSIGGDLLTRDDIEPCGSCDVYCFGGLKFPVRAGYFSIDDLHPLGNESTSGEGCDTRSNRELCGGAKIRFTILSDSVSV